MPFHVGFNKGKIHAHKRSCKPLFSLWRDVQFYWSEHFRR